MLNRSTLANRFRYLKRVCALHALGGDLEEDAARRPPTSPKLPGVLRHRWAPVNGRIAWYVAGVVSDGVARTPRRSAGLSQA